MALNFFNMFFMSIILFTFQFSLFNCIEEVMIMTKINDSNESSISNNDNNYINKESNPVGYFWLIFLSFLYGLISIISIVGNSLIICTIVRNKRMRNVTNFFICNLALADIVIGFLVSPFQVFYI